MPGKIFVNYRRDDERSAAARVRDRLASEFGASNVFMDVDNLMAGQRFDKELEKALAETDIFLAVMGPRWLELFEERQASGERDYVREEIAEALKRGIIVIPVLIEQAVLPRSDDLPEDIRQLVLHQKHKVVHEQFGRDVEALIGAIRFGRMPNKHAKRSRIERRLWPWILAGALAVLVAWLANSHDGSQVAPHTEVKKEIWMLADAKNASFEPLGDIELPSTASRLNALGGGRLFINFPDNKQLVIPSSINSDLSQEQLEKLCGEFYAMHSTKGADGATADRERTDAAIREAIKADRDQFAAAAKQDPALSVKPGSGQSFKDKLADRKPCPMCPEMVVVPNGSFAMGSNDDDRLKPVHVVTIGKPFAVGKFAVTFDEWDACVSENACGYYPYDNKWGRGIQPVINVSWNEAKTYVTWLSAKTGKGYRLLSEAEWEYAARAGTRTRYPWGDNIGIGNANCNGCGSKWDGKQPAPVGTFKPNAFGLHDMLGNVWQRVEDADHQNYEGAPTDGSAWTSWWTAISPSFHVMRGGSWYYPPDLILPTTRNAGSPDSRDDNIGFRVARSLGP